MISAGDRIGSGDEDRKYKCLTEVCKTLSQSLDETIDAAVEIFKSPTCNAVDNCYIVDFKKYLKPILTGQTSVPALWQNDQSVMHLGKALNWMLAALRYVPWTEARGETSDGQLNDTESDALVIRYFSNIKLELSLAGAAGAVHSQLAFIENGLQTGSIRENQVVEKQIEGIILGYTYYLIDNYGVQVDWPKIKDDMGAREDKVTIQVAQTSEPEISPPPPPLPQQPPPPLSVKTETTPPDKPKPAEKKKKARSSSRADSLPTPPAPGQEKRKKLEDIAKAGGGKLRVVEKPADMVYEIKDALWLKKPQKHYQILFMIDVSSSMADNIKETRDHIDSIALKAFDQLESGGTVDIAIHYYVASSGLEKGIVKNVSEIPVPLHGIAKSKGSALDIEIIGKKLTPKQKALDEAASAKWGLNEALKFTTEVGGDTEYHWEEAMKAMKKENWSEDKDVEKVIFLLTDEPGDIGVNEYTEDDVKKTAKSKDIRFEIIQCSNPPQDLINIIINKKEKLEARIQAVKNLYDIYKQSSPRTISPSYFAASILTILIKKEDPLYLLIQKKYNISDTDIKKILEMRGSHIKL